MSLTLITQEQIEALPEDNDAQAFAMFERICRDEMNRLTASFGQNDPWSEVRFEYMIQVSGAADTFGIIEMADAPAPSTDHDSFERFYSKAVAVSLRYGLAGRRERSSQSVELGRAAKGRLKKHADALSEALEAADLPESRREKLRGKLKEFTDELEKERSSIARMMAAVAVVSAALTPVAGLIGTVEDDLIKAPKALEVVQKIVGIIGHAKGVEIDHAPPPARLPAPPKRIEDRSDAKIAGGYGRGSGRGRGSVPRETFPADLDDEIPF